MFDDREKYAGMRTSSEQSLGIFSQAKHKYLYRGMLMVSVHVPGARRQQSEGGGYDTHENDSFKKSSERIDQKLEGNINKHVFLAVNAAPRFNQPTTVANAGMELM